MAKLSDTALAILSHAALHENKRVYPLPKLSAPHPVITNTLKALVASRLLATVAARREDVVWAEEEPEGKVTLVVTGDGLAAIGVEPDDDEHHGVPSTKRRVAKTKSKVTKPLSPKRPTTTRPSVTVGGATKQDVIVELLRRKDGAGIADLMEATGWQAHSVRGFMAGTLKKKLKLDVTSSKEPGAERIYRIAKTAKK